MLDDGKASPLVAINFVIAFIGLLAYVALPLVLTVVVFQRVARDRLTRRHTAAASVLPSQPLVDRRIIRLDTFAQLWYHIHRERWKWRSRTHCRTVTKAATPNKGTRVG